MNKLRAIELFVQLSDQGSFTRLANELNVSKSMISKEINRLEDELGARLLNRSTRKLQLTQVGEGYLKHCREILLKCEDADSYVQDHQGAPKGKLKINAPMALGLSHLSTLFSEFMHIYPEIELDIHLSDEPIDLIQEGFDLGFRAASKVFDSQYIGKELYRFQYKICTSRRYLENHSAINHPIDLCQHNCFVYSYFRDKNVWPLGEGIQVKGTLKVNNTAFMLESIRQGLGIGFIPDFICDQAIQSGEVIELFPQEKRPNLTLYALYPARQHVPPKLRHCLEFVETWFKERMNTE